jgi:hypothetical protein
VKSEQLAAIAERRPASRLASALGLAIVFAGPVTDARADGRFDGAWTTIVSCTNLDDALGYSFEFPSTVRDGVLHGEKGIKSAPGWLQIDGTIHPDGSAQLYADGLVGAPQFAVGARPAGTQYGYHINAKFAGGAGSGNRVEGRPCTVTFSKSG